MRAIDHIRAQLEAALESLADEALRLLREATTIDDDAARAALVATEKRVTRARRALEKAIHLLDADG